MWTEVYVNRGPTVVAKKYHDDSKNMYVKKLVFFQGSITMASENLVENKCVTNDQVSKSF